MSPRCRTRPQQIEERHVDIYDHDHWFRTGFAFVDQFSEAGREYFHRACQFYPTYSRAECDKQYDYCLRANREGVTIRTFFGYAQDAGIDIRTRAGKSPSSPKPPKSPQNADGNNGDIGDSGGAEQVGLPTFSDLVAQNLPSFLKTVASYGRNAKETDTMLLAAISVISGCLPHFQGVYDDRTVFPNLFFFLSARAGSGKGRMDLCRQIAGPIHRRLKEEHAKKLDQYELELAAWEAAPKKSRGPKPQKPDQTMLYIPADTSATALNQLLSENCGCGIIFDTEADGLADSFESDFGNYSKSFRAAFHHESISYHRRGGDEDVEIENPKLSAILSGTPKQVIRLIGSAENGLFSRFMFYRLESELVWHSVLKNQNKVTMDDKFNALGEEFLQFYDDFCQGTSVHFMVTDAQNDAFDNYFRELMHDYVRIFQEDILGSVFRLGLICYRIAMVLTALRMKDNADVSSEVTCDDVDFNTALTISRVLAVHMAKIYDELTANEGSRSSIVAKTASVNCSLPPCPMTLTARIIWRQRSEQGRRRALPRNGYAPSVPMTGRWKRWYTDDTGNADSSAG